MGETCDESNLNNNFKKNHNKSIEYLDSIEKSFEFLTRETKKNNNL